MPAEGNKIQTKYGNSLFDDLDVKLLLKIIAMKRQHFITALVALVFATVSQNVFSQYTVSGKITDKENGKSLAGATFCSSREPGFQLRHLQMALIVLPD